MDILVRVAGVHIHRREVLEHFVQHRGLPGLHHLALRGVVDQGDVAAEEDTGIPVHIFQVLAQPLDVFLEYAAAVVALAVDVLVAGVFFAVVDIFHRIHKYPVVTAHVERIAGGAPGVTVVPRRDEIGAAAKPGDGSVVVVVAGHRIDRAGETGAHQELLGVVFIEIEIVPEAVVGEISEIHGKDRPASRRSFVFPANRGHYALLKTVQAVPRRIVREVAVGDENHAVLALVLRLQLEIVHLGLLRRLCQQLPEAGTHGVDHLGHVAGRGGDEHHAVGLVGLHTIPAPGVGEDYLPPVGDLHARDGFALGRDTALYHSSLHCEREEGYGERNEYPFHSALYFSTG